MSKHYSEQFRRQAVDHVLSHPEQSMVSTAKLLVLLC